MVDTTKLGEVPENVRQVAETTLGKAREAVDAYLKQATETLEKVSGHAAAAQGDAQNMAKKAAGFAGTNITAAFDLAQELIRAKSLEEVTSINKKFIESQTTQLRTQFGELGQDATSSAKGFASTVAESASEMATKALKTTTETAKSVGEAVRGAAGKAADTVKPN